MRRIRVSRILALAAVLPMAGCDYWENLTEEKRPARTHLRVAFLDAWTGDPVPYIACRDSALGLEWLTGGDHLLVAEVPTGEYALACSSLEYLETRIAYRATAVPHADTLRLARKGGIESWYPDAPRAVRHPLAADTVLRFPVRLDWTAQPADASGRFRYSWTFAKATRLNQEYRSGPVSSRFLKPGYSEEAHHGLGIAPGPDTACLTVHSRIIAPEREYLAGRDCRAFEWSRNLPPWVDLDPTGAVGSFQVGCGPKSLRLLVKAGDSLGSCRTLRIRAPDTLSSLGNLDTLLDCKASQAVILPLRMPSRPLEIVDTAGNFPAAIIAEATDDNGDKGYDTLRFYTFPNKAPKTESGLRLGRDVYFPGDSVWFWIDGHDTDGTIQSATFYWGGPKQDSLPNPSSQLKDFRVEAFNIFQTPGKTFIQTWATDNCGERGLDWVNMEVRENTQPSISFTSSPKVRIGDTTFHQFFLTVKDVDVDDDLDSLKVKVYWGDGETTSFSTRNGNRPANQAMLHHYGNAPTAGPAYPIRIEVRDAHQGASSLDTLLTY